MVEGPHRTVTVRELAREMKSLFDEVATRGLSLIVIRHSSPIVRIVPLGNQPVRLLATSQQSGGPIPMSSADLEELKLDDLQRRVLIELPEASTPDRLGRKRGTDFGKIALALARAEIKGLCKNTGGGAWILTLNGLRAVATLQADSDGGGAASDDEAEASDHGTGASDNEAGAESPDPPKRD